MPIRRIEQSHLPKGHLAIFAWTVVFIPDSNGPVIPFSGFKHRAVVDDVNGAIFIRFSGIPNRRIYICGLLFGFENLYLVRRLESSVSVGSNFPAQSWLPNIDADWVLHVFASRIHQSWFSHGFSSPPFGPARCKNISAHGKNRYHGDIYGNILLKWPNRRRQGLSRAGPVFTFE